MKTSMLFLFATIGSFLFNGCAKDEAFKKDIFILELGQAKGSGSTLSAPSGLFGVAVTSTSIWLSWKDNTSNESGFIVERKSNKNNYVSIGTLPANSTSYQDNSVASGVTYSYRVKAYTGNSSAYSNIITASTTTNITTGLVAYYSFNGNANDMSGNTNNGTVNTGVVLASDRFNNSNSAYNFQGGTITIPHQTYLAIPQSGQFSVSLWLNKTGTQNPAHIIGKRGSGAYVFNWQLAQHLNPGGGLAGGLSFTGVINSTYTGIGYEGVTNPVLQLNQWEHIVGTYNNGKWILYKNGVSITQITVSTYAPDTGTPPVEIGNCGGWGAYFGLIDDIRIYNRELSQNDVNYLFMN